MNNVISLRPRRTPPLLTTAEQVTAVFTHRALYELAAVIPAKDRVGRPRLFPPYLLLGYGVLTRVFRSGARVSTTATTLAGSTRRYGSPMRWVGSVSGIGNRCGGSAAL